MFLWWGFVLSVLTGIICFCRLKKGKQLEKEEAINEVKKNIHLIKAPHAGKDFFLSYQMAVKQDRWHLCFLRVQKKSVQWKIMDQIAHNKTFLPVIV